MGNFEATDKGFDRWWDADEMAQTNQFTEDTPAWWAWEGWRAAKREWVGLTKDEVDSWELPNSPTVFEFYQFIEAKLKEKNT